MADFKEFCLQLTALGMEPKDGSSTRAVFERARALTGGGEDVDLGAPALRALWADLKPQALDISWPECEYRPERALQRRALMLAEKAIAESDSDPRLESGGFTESWGHLFLHGKLGLMAALFNFEKARPQTTVGDIASFIEEFMDVIEAEFERLLRAGDRHAIARALRLPLMPELPLAEFLRGRLQPFALARSLYLEGEFPRMRPLQWWVLHERFIPDLPNAHKP